LHADRLDSDDTRCLLRLWNEYNPNGLFVLGFDEVKGVHRVRTQIPYGCYSVFRIGEELFKTLMPALEHIFTVTVNMVSGGSRTVMRTQFSAWVTVRCAT
jgi:hypothetical protein